jgi:hypothetical protein
MVPGEDPNVAHKHLFNMHLTEGKNLYTNKYTNNFSRLSSLRARSREPLTFLRGCPVITCSSSPANNAH